MLLFWYIYTQIIFNNKLLHSSAMVVCQKNINIAVTELVRARLYTSAKGFLLPPIINFYQLNLKLSCQRSNYLKLFN